MCIPSWSIKASTCIVFGLFKQRVGFSSLFLLDGGKKMARLALNFVFLRRRRRVNGFNKQYKETWNKIQFTHPNSLIFISVAIKNTNSINIMWCMFYIHSPQRAASSSEPSPQSSCLSHFHLPMMHLPFLHLNSFGPQVLFWSRKNRVVCLKK